VYIPGLEPALSLQPVLLLCLFCYLLLASCLLAGDEDARLWTIYLTTVSVMWQKIINCLFDLQLNTRASGVAAQSRMWTEHASLTLKSWFICQMECRAFKDPATRHECFVSSTFRPLWNCTLIIYAVINPREYDNTERQLCVTRLICVKSCS